MAGTTAAWLASDGTPDTVQGGLVRCRRLHHERLEHAPQRNGHRLPRHRIPDRTGFPNSARNAIFIHGHGFATTAENVVLGPLVAILSFVCSIGNVPLWKGGISRHGPASTSEVDGQHVYFCSEDCQHRFAQNLNAKRHPETGCHDGASRTIQWSTRRVTFLGYPGGPHTPRPFLGPLTKQETPTMLSCRVCRPSS